MAWTGHQRSPSAPAVPFKRRGRRRRQQQRSQIARWSRSDLLVVAIACAGLLAYAAWNRFVPSGPLSEVGVTFCSYDPRGNCLADGDSGQHDGMRWRMVGFDTPEIGSAECNQEKRLAFRARSRLQQLMASGYRLQTTGQYDKYGRALVSVVLTDGRNAGRVLVDEGLAQLWPNSGNIWCDQRDATAPEKKISR